MKKVSTGEKIFLIGVTSFAGGINAYVGNMTTIEAAVINGILFGSLGGFLIGLLHKVRG